MKITVECLSESRVEMYNSCRIDQLGVHVSNAKYDVKPPDDVTSFYMRFAAWSSRMSRALCSKKEEQLGNNPNIFTMTRDQKELRKTNRCQKLFHVQFRREDR
ncbi:hypothetical protein PoB_004070400 [Plakobranchus ocellatus]|uniref:Uncharacterized protein n=1 Tax=Plakobranchus ocellatus TaxID=259542 RepID=A0AAV4B688_9GAST|nr:hypothetical protein PoB_004070400 [Plakobranchus ocellatus]